jgi:hypothetical protein
VTYENRLTVGLVAVLLGAILAAVNGLIYWLSGRDGGRAGFVLGLAIFATGIYLIFVADGGVPA